ncbi:integral membrane protein 2B-like [Acanthaster planci]|uniref:Integral membrane protein 2 n=1 Tax=Acanthaster planci TaxID=133434 RepID=A0A8B7YPR7_ACAPL|nr:integral membrane protein 2B-like [Acanthaster planci]
MKIYAADKVQQAKVVYDGETYTTVAVPSKIGQYACKCKDGSHVLTKSSHPEVTPNHRQSRCWNFGMASCLIFSIVASVGLCVLLYSAARPVPLQDSFSVDECEVPILPDQQEPLGYKEHMTTDKKNMIETFDIPEMNANHPATIMHDFYNEITIYLDRLEDTCFIMKLNTTEVVQPKHLLEAFIRYKRGDFDLDIDTIRETMHVQMPPLSDLAPLGLGAEILCEDLPTYWLVNPRTPALRKRSIHSDEHHVTYFNGQYMVDLTVINAV